MPKADSRRRQARRHRRSARLNCGKIVGTARVRVVPDLPIGEDFESFKDGDIVGWWIGVSKAKYVDRDPSTARRS